jgi:MOSC domain-containing protein YiiM
MATGRILQIWTSPEAGADMVLREEVAAHIGKGLEGDRYCNGTGSWTNSGTTGEHEMTLIESEQLAWFLQETGQELTAPMSRRNILTEGIDLNELVGQRFHVGPVEVEGIRLCEPCATLQKRTGLTVLPAMVGHSGLNCRILTGGIIRTGDSVG